MEIRTRGRTFTGIVVRARMQSTVTVEWARRKYVPKYERYEKARTRVKAHNPAEIAAEEGDIVKIKECTPISKSKHFIIIEKVSKDKLYEAKKELLEEGKHKVEKKRKTVKKKAEEPAEKAEKEEQQ